MDVIDHLEQAPVRVHELIEGRSEAERSAGVRACCRRASSPGGDVSETRLG